MVVSLARAPSERPGALAAAGALVPTYPQTDVTFTQAGQPVVQVDSTLTAMSLPRLVSDYVAFRHQVIGPASVKGALQLVISDAPVAKDQLVGSPFWTPIPDLVLDVGGKDLLPSYLRTIINDGTWVALSWTPGPGTAGLFGVRFGGVRR